jgi:hypothetical protein
MADFEKEVARLSKCNAAYLNALCDHYPYAVKSGLIKEWANCLRTFADLAESFCPIEKAANAQSQIDEPGTGDEMTAASDGVCLTHKPLPPSPLIEGER